VTISTQDLAAEVSRAAFGALLAPQGRGFYIPLELLAIVWGTIQLGKEVLPSPEEQPEIVYLRRSHDFARRWMGGEPEDITAVDRTFVKGDEAPEILRALLISLRVPIPNRRTLPGWGGQHLYPYVGELIHYDAVPRRGKQNPVSIEQYTFRGGGGLVYRMLRSDPDKERLGEVRSGLSMLAQDSEGPLGQLAKACTSHDRAEPSPFIDQREKRAEVRDTVWVDVLRSGVRNITGRDDLSRAKQVELLMHFVPFCIARHQLDCSAELLGEDRVVLPASLVTRTSPIRKISRKEFDHARGLIDRSLDVALKRLGDDVDAPEKAALLEAAARTRTWRTGITSFFAGTLATSGGLNAHTGSRYVTIQLSLLEALVCAMLPPGREVEFESFCTSILANQLGLIVDHRSASAFGFTDRIDADEFVQNAAQLAQDLSGLGLLSEFSDATRMVRGEVS
jgi:hypothetical protein